MTDHEEASDAQLRKAFRALGRELDLDDPAPIPLAGRGLSSRRRLGIVVAAGVIAASAVVVTALVGSQHSDTPSTPPAGVSDTRFEAIACAKQILVGRATNVRPGKATGRVTVTFTVEQWIKPAQGPTTVTFADTLDPRITGEFPAWDLDLERLLFVPKSDDELIAQFTDQYTDPAPIIALVKKELAQGLRTPCPSTSQ